WRLVKHPFNSTHISASFNVAGRLILIKGIRHRKQRFQLPYEFRKLGCMYSTMSGSRIFLLLGMIKGENRYLDLENVCVIESNPSLADWSVRSLHRYKNGKNIMRAVLPKHLSEECAAVSNTEEEKDEEM
ncbi:hypothetical protein PFISCL1PPCAC_12111, partial [Pristionchus fissidentatus]